MKFGQPEHIKKLFLPKAQRGLMIDPNMFQVPDINNLLQTQTMAPQQNFGVQGQNPYGWTQPMDYRQPQDGSNLIAISESELLNPTTQYDTSIFTDREQLNRMAQNKASNTYLDNYDEDGQVIDQNKQAEFNDRLNLINPYGGFGIEAGLAYGAFMAGQGKGGQAALGIGRGLLGAARIGMNAYSKGKAYKDGVNAQNNTINPNYVTLRNGGEVTMSELLTGKYITDQPVQNIEIEEGEYTYNSQTGQVQEAVGEKHENGGIPTYLPPQSKVLSDYDKVGRINAKELSKFLDVKVKANDTYAGVLEKYSNKIGVKKNTKEEAKLIEKAEDLLSKEDNDTKDLNSRFLQTKFQENEEKKQELNQKQQEAFQKIFDIQEKAKPTQVPIEADFRVVMQQGGEVNPQQILEQMMSQGMSEEEAIAYMEQQMTQPDIIQQVIQALQQGADPQEVLAYLVEQGMSQDQAIQVIEQVMQQGQTQDAQQLMQDGGTVEDAIAKINALNGFLDIQRGDEYLYYDMSGKLIATLKQDIGDRLNGFTEQEGVPYSNYRYYINEDKVTEAEAKKGADLAIKMANESVERNARIDIANSKKSPFLLRYNAQRGVYEVADTSDKDLKWFSTSDEEVYATLLYTNNLAPEDAQSILDNAKNNGRVITMGGKGASVSANKKAKELSKKLTENPEYGQDAKEPTAQAQSSNNQAQTSSDYDFSTSISPTVDGRTVTSQRVTETDRLTAEPIQSFAGAQGYGRNVQDIDRFLNTHSWYFTDDSKKEQFRNAVGTRGSQQAVKDFQEAYNNELRKRGKEIGLSDAEIESQINEVGFTNDGVRKLDGMFGAYTSSRPMFSATPTTQQAEAVNNDEVIASEGYTPQTVNRLRNVIPMLPNMFTMPPSAMQIPRQDSVSFNRINPVTRTPEVSIAQANNQANFAIEQAYANNPNLAPFLAANLLGTTQQSANQAIAETDTYNAQAINQANLYNAQAGDKEQLMNINLNQNFEQRLFGSLANQEADWRRFFTNTQLQQRQNWQDVNNLNLMNQLYPNFQSDGSNMYFSNPRDFQPGSSSAIPLHKRLGAMTEKERKEYYKTGKLPS